MTSRRPTLTNGQIRRMIRNHRIMLSWYGGYSPRVIARQHNLTEQRICQIIAENRPQMERQS